MVFSMAAAAAETVSFSGMKAEGNADRLYALGLFKGTGTNPDGTPVYALEKTATRMEGLVMLIRLLGEEADALAYTGECPFTDVPGWARQYAAYAYGKGYTNGTSATTFTPGTEIDFNSYVTFLLRALGYNDQQGDFTWKKSVEKAAGIGLIDEASAKLLSEQKPVLYRADLVNLSFSALTMRMKGKSTTLAGQLVQRGVFTRSKGVQQGVLNNGKICYTYEAPKIVDLSTVTRTTKTFELPSGKVTADVITVNTGNSKVKIQARLVNNTIGATDSFSNIVAQSGAKVVVNSNFFEAYKDYKVPLGMVMCDGTFLYGEAGLPLFAFDAQGGVQAGNPGIVLQVTSGKKTWTCFQCNMKNNNYTYGILYNSGFGPSFTVDGVEGGVAATVRGDVIQESRTVHVGDIVEIPSDGYVLYFGHTFVKADYFRDPAVGASVSVEPIFFRSNSDGMTLEGIEQIVSGAPCLVDNGEICTVLPAGFQEERFTSMITPRTAIGKLANGKLILVSTNAASIQQMRELMLELGCVEAMNLDGGGSTALAYDGQIVRAPGRKLTTTLHVFVDE